MHAQREHRAKCTRKFWLTNQLVKIFRKMIHSLAFFTMKKATWSRERSHSHCWRRSLSRVLVDPFHSISFQLSSISFHLFIFVSFSWQWEAKTTRYWELCKPNTLRCNDSKLSINMTSILLFFLVLIHMSMFWSSIFMHYFRI